MSGDFVLLTTEAARDADPCDVYRVMAHELAVC